MDAMTSKEFDEWMRTEWIEQFVKGVHKSKWLKVITVTMDEKTGKSRVPMQDWNNAIKDELEVQYNKCGGYWWD